MKTAPRFSKLRPIPAAIITSFGTVAAFLMPDLALANPSGGTVVGGQATITTPSSNGTVITQTTASTIINWNQFNIGSGQYVQFVQPSSSSIALNRVIGGSPSTIFGSLEANGRVFLVNPDGVLFAPGSSVDVGGLLATTMDIKNSDFMAGNYVFSGTGEPGASIVNAGTITTSAGGFAVLAGDTVSNSGIIQAQLGQVVLASGSATTLNLDGSGLINYSIDQAALSAHAGVTNTGELIADGGRVVMAASTARSLVSTAVNNSGIIRAEGISNHDGRIELTATGGDIANTGTLNVSNTAGQGGSIAITGDRDVTLGKGATLLANGTSGGSVSVIADDTLVLTGGSLIQALGSSGPGGFAEVSGHGLLDIRGAIKLGKGGRLLIDPTDLIIGTGAYGSSTDGGTETITQSSIETMLKDGTSVQLVASNSVTFDPLTGGKLDGTNAGDGGSLTIGIGSVSGSTFTAGTGGGTITAMETTDTIAVDGVLTVASGTGTGTISLGGLSGYSVEMTAGGAISVGNTIAATNLVKIQSTSGNITTDNITSDNNVTIQSTGGTITTGDITVTAAGISYPQDQNGITVQTGNPAVAGDMTGAAITVGNLTVTNTAPAGYGNATVLVNSSGSSVTAGSIQATSTNGQTAVTVRDNGTLHVTGGITAIGIGSGSTDGASVTLFSNAGSVVVGGATNVTGMATTVTSTNPDAGTSTTLKEGDAGLFVTSGGGDITMGAVSMSAVGTATFEASASDSITMNGAIDVSASRSTNVTTNDGGSTTTTDEGNASVSLAASSIAAISGPDNTTSVTTNGVTVQGPSADLVIGGGTLNLKAGAGTDAIDVTANTGAPNNPGTAYYNLSNSDGTSVYTSNSAAAVVELLGIGGSSVTPSITSAPIDVSGPTATLNMVADGNITINGGLTVAAQGYTVTGEMSQAPPASTFNNADISLYGYKGSITQPALLNGSVTVGQGLLAISGNAYSSNDEATPTLALTVGAVDVTGPVAVSGVGASSLNLQATSLSTGAVTVSASPGSLQGTANSTIYTVGSADADSYAGYTITRTIGSSDDPATFGLASALITTTGDLSANSIALTGLSGQLNFSAKDVSVPGGISVTSFGVPSYVETDIVVPFSGSYGDATAPPEPAVPATASTTWTGDVNQLVVTATGAITTGDVTLSGSGLTDLYLSGASIAVGNVTLTETGGLFVSTDPSRVSGSYSYANAGSQLFINASGSTPASAASITATSNNSVALRLAANIAGELSISTPDFLTSLSGVESLVNPVFQALPSTSGAAAPANAPFTENLVATAGTALLDLGSDATLNQISLTTTGQLELETETTGTFTLGTDTTLTGGNILIAGLNLIAPNLTLISTNAYGGDISGDDINATSLTVTSQGNVTFGNITTSQTASTDPTDGGTANAAVNITASGSIGLGSINATANAAAATASVSLTAGTSITVGAITTTATEDSTDANNTSGLNNGDSAITVTAQNGALTLTGPVTSTITTNSNSDVEGTIALTDTGGAITGGNLSSAFGAINVSNTTGDVTLGNLATTRGFGSVSVNAPDGFVSLGTVSTFGGGLTVTAGGVNTLTGDGLSTGAITTVADPSDSTTVATVALTSSAGNLLVDGAISATDVTTGANGSNASVNISDTAGNVGLMGVTTSASDPGQTANATVTVNGSGSVNMGDISSTAVGGSALSGLASNAGTSLMAGTIQFTSQNDTVGGVAYGGVGLAASAGDLVTSTITGLTSGVVTALNSPVSLSDAGGNLQTGAISTQAGNIGLSDSTGNITTGTLQTTMGAGTSGEGTVVVASTAGSVNVGQITAYGGSVTLMAASGLQLAGIQTTAYAPSASGAVDGSVTLSTDSGTLMATGPINTAAQLTSGAAVNNADVTITNGSGPIDLGAISTSAASSLTGTADAVVTITATKGLIAVDGITTSASGATANASVALTAGTSAQSTAAIETSATENSSDVTNSGGLNSADADVAITAYGGALTLTTLTSNVTIANQSTVDGNLVVTATGGNITAGDLSSTDGGINVSNTSGNATLGNLTTALAFGSVSVDAAEGYVSVGNIKTFGGGVALSAGGTNAATGDGLATGSISTTGDPSVATSDGSVALVSAGNLLVSGPISTTDTSTGSTSVNASVSVLDTGGSISLGNVTTSASDPGQNAQGQVQIGSTTGSVVVGNLSTSATGSVANASVEVSAAGTLSAGTTMTTATSGTAGGAGYGGVILIATAGDLDSGAITTAVSAGTGGLLDGSAQLLDTGGNLQAQNVSTEAGKIALTDTTGNITAGTLGTTLGAGSAGQGNITATANAGSINVGAVSAYGGSVDLTAATGLQVAGITTTAFTPSTSGEVDGSVTLSTGSGTLMSGAINATAQGAGSPTTNASVTVTDGTGPIVLNDVASSATGDPTGGLADAAVSVTATTGSVSVGRITTLASGAAANGSLALTAGTSVQASSPLVTSATGNSTDTTNSAGLNNADADVAITAYGGALTLTTVTTEVAIANPSTVDGDIVLADAGGNIMTGNLSSTYGGVSITNSTGDITTADITTADAFGAVGIAAKTGWVDVGNLNTFGGVSISSGATNATTGAGLETGGITTDSDPSQTDSDASVNLLAATGSIAVLGPILTKAASTNPGTTADGSVTILADAGSVSLGTVTTSATEGSAAGEIAKAGVKITSDTSSITLAGLSTTAKGNQANAAVDLGAATVLTGTTLSTEATAAGTGSAAYGGVILSAAGGNLGMGAITTSVGAGTGGFLDGSVAITDKGGTLTTSNISTQAGAIDLVAQTGNAVTGNLTTAIGAGGAGAGAIDVSAAAGTVTVGTIMATGGGVDLSAGTGLSAGSITTASATGQTGALDDSIQVSQVSGNLKLTGPISASAASTTGASATANITVTDNAGTVSLGDLTASATGTGATTAAVSLTGGAGVAVDSVATTGDINLQSTSGSVAVTKTLTAGTDLTIGAGTTATVGGASQLGSAGDGALNVTAGTGVTLGDVTNQSAATAVGTANDMTITSTSGNIMLADIGVPATGTSSLTVTADEGSITTGNLTAERVHLDATATGSNITTGNLDLFSLTPSLAGNSLVDAGGKVVIGTLSTDGGLTASAGGASLQLGTTTAAGPVMLTASAGTIATGTITTTAGGVSATAGGASLQLGNTSSSGAITLSAANGTISTGTLTSTGSGLTVTDGGASMALGNLSASGAIGLMASDGTISAGTVSAGGGLTASAGGASLTLGNTTSAGAVDLTAKSGSLTLGNLSGTAVTLATGDDFTYSHTLNSTGAVEITGGGAISFNDATVEGPQVTVTATKGVTVTGSTVGIVPADGFAITRGTTPLTDTATLTSSTGDVDVASSTINSGLVTLQGANIHLSNASTIDGTEVVMTGTGLVDAGAAAAGTSDESTIAAGALSVKGNQIDFSNAVLTIGSGLANFGTDATLLSGIRAADPSLLPASTGPNAAFSAPAGVTLGTISVAGGYLYVQSNALVLPSPTGAGKVFINYVPTDPAAAITLTGVTPPAGAMTIALGGSSQTGDITIGDGTEHFSVAPLGTNFVLDSAGTIFYPDAIVTSGRVISLGKTVLEFNPSPVVELLVPEGVPLTDEEYRTEYVSPTIELLPDIGSLIDIITSTGATACSVGGGT